ncbi:MAG: hypothetical protein ACYTBJ_27420 [Planctomycetota bacterium]|jgi:hypothetical protein
MDIVDTIEDLIVSALKAQDTGFYAVVGDNVLEIFDSDDCLVFSGDSDDEQQLYGMNGVGSAMRIIPNTR